MRTPIRAISVLSLLFLFALALPGTGETQPPPTTRNSLRSLDYATLGGGKIMIKVVFGSELAEPPSVFKTYHPTMRMVLEFSGVASAVPKQPIKIEQGDLRALQVVQSGTRTRLIISLLRPMIQETEVAGNELLITLRRPELP